MTLSIRPFGFMDRMTRATLAIGFVLSGFASARGWTEAQITPVVLALAVVLILFDHKRIRQNIREILATPKN